MSRVFFGTELETVGIYWRVERNDGVTLGFTSHDRDLLFDGLVYRTAPGMLPSAIRKSASLEQDSAEVQGALSHDTIRLDDLVGGRFDNARIEIGLVDWENLDRTYLYTGDMGSISCDGTGFEAELRSIKAVLDSDLVPRTSPTCRARFCGPGCGLSSSRFCHEAVVSTNDPATGRLIFVGGPPVQSMQDGHVRWIDGPYVGSEMEVIEATSEGLLLEDEISSEVKPGMRALLREGCDHTIATCEQRFANSINFRGEPFLPGNDALVRYPTSSS